ncbi:HNH endonuclease [Pseudomonas segetis]|uniref:HNH endonuclease n=1 Tax=Pseudomonas segetis TaxID=298908 RepID=A0A239CB92_9PSED|nr:HNH endonuclease [Pseudomonas segetis]SNS16714.1 HNH endonuclease [Pseudomonas segetis]
MPKAFSVSGRPSNEEIIAELKRLMRYEPETGNFIRIMDRNQGKTGQIAGCSRRDGRVEIGLLGYRFLAHRLAVAWMTGAMPGEEVDHINCDHSDNRWTNLRACSHAENMRNRRFPGRTETGIKGIRYHKAKNNYEAVVIKNRTTYKFGRFSTIEEAIHVLDIKRKELHGDFARA